MKRIRTHLDLFIAIGGVKWKDGKFTYQLSHLDTGWLRGPSAMLHLTDHEAHVLIEDAVEKWGLKRHYRVEARCYRPDGVYFNAYTPVGNLLTNEQFTTKFAALCAAVEHALVNERKSA